MTGGTAKLFAGSALLLVVIAALFVGVAIDEGIKDASIAFLAAGLGAAVILAGAFLIADGITERVTRGSGQ